MEGIMAVRLGNDGEDLHREQASTPTVLVIDEDLDEARRYCALLRDKGYEVRCTCSYAEGEACLKDRPVDFVIVSQGSRAFEGRRSVKRAVRTGRKPPVLVLARETDTSCHVEAMLLGASDYLPKSISAEVILEQVTKQTGHPR
jgi:DNA-binding response OmpR family regulator